MASLDTFGAKSQLRVGDASYEIFRIDAWTGHERLPYSLKILLENLLRTEDGANITADHIRALGRLGPGRRAERGDPVHPGPGAHAGLHRRARASSTWPPCARRWPTSAATRPRSTRWRPAELVIDHSVIADVFGRAGRLRAQRRARVRAQPRALPVPALGPDARSTSSRSCRPAPASCTRSTSSTWPAWSWHRGRRQAYPDTLVGTDSHTTDGQRPRRARLGRRRHRGRGGDARPAGLACSSPGWSASSCTGELPEGATATDLVLTITEMLRKHGVVGKFVEFYGPGVGRGAAGQPGHHRQHDARSTARPSPSSRSTTRPCATCGSPAARASRSRWSRRTPRSRACGTTRPPSRTTRSASSSTCRPSCRRWPARSARRTGSRSPTPRRCSAPRWPTTSTRRRRGRVDEASAESFPASDPPATTSRRPRTARPVRPPRRRRPAVDPARSRDDGTEFELDHGAVVDRRHHLAAPTRPTRR